MVSQHILHDCMASLQMVLFFCPCTIVQSGIHSHVINLKILFMYMYISYKYHHSTNLYRKISRVYCRGIVMSAKHE